MKVLWLFAHPEHRSLNAALKDDGVRTLQEHGHTVQVSDLYAMKWNPVVHADDFGHDTTDRLIVGDRSERAYSTGELSPEIVAEQEKLAWADTVIIQFPLWWHGMPAILKGWFDRVFVKGFAYGVQDDRGRTLRYGEGGLAGKRAITIVTAGAPGPTFGPRGINGDLGSLLFPLHHGTLFYAGMTVLPPFLVTGANRVSPEQYEATAAGLRDRLLSLGTTDPIPFRTEHGGDYDTDLVLRPHVAPGAEGVSVHREG